MRLRLRDGDHIAREWANLEQGELAAAMRLRLRDGDHSARSARTRAIVSAAMRLRLRDGDHHESLPGIITAAHTLQCGSVSGTEITCNSLFRLTLR